MAIKQEAAIRKRQQIAKASRLMFIWVAVASVVVGASAVLIVLFAQKLAFNQRVINAKYATIDNLNHNISIVDELKDNIRVLNTNEALLRLKVPADKDAVQVVFDALPSTPNSAALGSSLQSGSLLGQQDVKIESLTLTPISGVEDSATGDDSNFVADEGAVEENAISFEFSVSVAQDNANALKAVMQKLEQSIRAINVTSLRFEKQGDRLMMTAKGYGYYEPATKVELQEGIK